MSGPAGVTPDEGCEACHLPSLGGLTERAGIRVLHRECAKDRGCVTCHGSSIHGEVSRVPRAYAMEDCTACHRDLAAPVHCATCHSERTKRERLTTSAWQVTHGAEWNSTHGLGSLRSCAECHPSDYCVRCHGTALPHPPGFGQTHGDEAKKDLGACTACHDKAQLCDACHGIEMPHPDGFLKAHSSIVSSVDQPECVRCHDSAECIGCHVRHVHPGNAKNLVGETGQ
ncbi:MAG: hypothetical protein EG823_01650 [Actinobacteria bacterium]|nr:hypothetical protein [Actinomycetota bacterium]